MSANDRNITRLRVRIVQWDVLLDDNVRAVIVAVDRGCEILAPMCAWQRVLDDPEEL